MKNYKNINTLEFNELVNKGDCTIVDVREPHKFNAKRIPNAINIPLSQCTSDSISELNTSNIIIYCLSGRRSENICKKLDNIANKNIFNLVGGILSFESNKGNVIKISSKMDIIQQVHITVGSMTLLGVILAVLSNFYWVYLSGFFGLGLLFSGITGRCGLATVIARMPWNKENTK